MYTYGTHDHQNICATYSHQPYKTPNIRFNLAFNKIYKFGNEESRLVLDRLLLTEDVSRE